MQSGPTHTGTEAITDATKNQSLAENYGTTALESADEDFASVANDGSHAEERRAQTSRASTSRHRRRGWSAIEIATLALLHAVYGNKWSVIAKHYRNRHDGDVKNIFHSALRSKATDANYLLRGYAQAVGPHCDDPRVRQAAYEAARQQYGSAPVLSSAAPYMHLPALSSPDNRGALEAGLGTRRSLPPVDEAGRSGEAPAESGPSQQQSAETGPSVEQLHHHHQQQQSADDEEHGASAGQAEPPSAARESVPATSPRRSRRLARTVRPMGHARTDIIDLDAESGGGGGGGDDAVPYYSPGRDVLLHLPSRSVRQVGPEPGAFGPCGDAVEAHPDAASLMEPPAVRQRGPAGWEQRGSTAATPSVQYHAQLIQQHQQQHQQQLHLQQFEQLHQVQQLRMQQIRQQQQRQQHEQEHHRQQQQQHQQLQQQEHQQRQQQQLTSYPPPSLPHAPLLLFHGAAIGQQQTQLPQQAPVQLLRQQQQQQQQQQQHNHHQQHHQHHQQQPSPSLLPLPQSRLQAPYTERSSIAAATAGHNQLRGAPGWLPPAAAMYYNMGLLPGPLDLIAGPSTFPNVGSRSQALLAPPTPPPVQGMAPAAAMALAGGDSNSGGAMTLGLGLDVGYNTMPPYPQRSMSGDGGANSGGLSFGGPVSGALEPGVGPPGKLRFNSMVGLRDPGIISLAGGGGDGGGDAAWPPPADPLEALLRDLESPFTSASSLLGRALPVDSNPHRGPRRPRLPAEAMGLPVTAPSVEGRLPIAGFEPPSPFGLPSSHQLEMWASVRPGGLLPAMMGPPNGTIATMSSGSSISAAGGVYGSVPSNRGMMPPPAGSTAGAGRMPQSLSHHFFPPGSTGSGGGATAAAFSPFGSVLSGLPGGAFTLSSGAMLPVGDHASQLRAGDSAAWPCWTGAAGAATDGATAAAAVASMRPSASAYITVPPAFEAPRTDGVQRQFWATAPQQQQQQQQQQLQQTAQAVAALRGAFVPSAVQFNPALLQEFGLGSAGDIGLAGAGQPGSVSVKLPQRD